MDNGLIVGVGYNAALLLLLSIVYNSFSIQYEKPEIWKSLVRGVAIGIIGIFLMLTPVKLMPGIFFDTRSILISVAGMFFGFIPTGIAVIMICSARIIIGGSGVLMGVLVTVSTAAIGLLWNKFRLQYITIQKQNVYKEFYAVGIIAHIAMMVCILALPRTQQLLVFKQIWYVLLLIYPIASLLLSIVVYIGYKNNQTRLALIDSEKKFKELYHEYDNKQTLVKTMINSIPDIIFYKNTKGQYLGCNAAFETFLGRTEDEIIGLTDWALFSAEKAESFSAVDKEIIKQGKPHKNDYMSTYPDGTELYFETLKTVYSDNQGTVLGVIGISRDITERKKREDETNYLTYHDGLTGLYNRAFFDEKIVDADFQQQLPLSVIIGDINGLKFINDAMGHKEGDKLLSEVAKILASSIRSEDIVARIGGDEFGILLPQSDSTIAQSVVERIKSACELYSTNMNKETYFASISLGHATKNSSGESIEKIIKSAEELMYRKKLLEHKSQHSSIMSAIKMTMYEKSHETEAHTERLVNLSEKLGKSLGFVDKEIDELALLSLLHDIGKIGIDDSILAKGDSLNDDEEREMKKHPEIGYRIAMASPELKHIAEYILCHHERWDGTGYPQGLSGENIPILSRVLSIIDSYDAMTYDRVYRKALSEEDAKSEILKNAGTQFDPVIAKLFVENVITSNPTLDVTISEGRTAVRRASDKPCCAPKLQFRHPDESV